MFACELFKNDCRGFFQFQKATVHGFKNSVENVCTYLQNFFQILENHMYKSGPYFAKIMIPNFLVHFPMYFGTFEPLAKYFWTRSKIEILRADQSLFTIVCNANFSK